MSKIKRVYFARHGQTVANIDHIVQGLDDALTDEGKHQANALAERAMGIEFDTLISSDLSRAVDTATPISTAVHIPIIKEPLFREVRRPSSFLGISRQTEEYQAFLKAEYDNMDNPEWQIEDGEHFPAGRDRALQALEYLEAKESDSIFVVTHGHFLRYMVATILTEKQLTPEAWRTISKTMFMHNTGITLCVLIKGHWQLVTWNDIAHFAE